MCSAYLAAKTKMAEDVLSNSPKSVSRLQLTIQVFVLIFTGVLGAFTDDFVQRLVPAPFTAENLPFSAAVLSIVTFIAAVAVAGGLHRDATNKTTDAQHELSEKLKALNHSVSRIEEGVGPLARVYPYEVASRLLLERIEAAEKEVLVLSNYSRFDWVSRKPTKIDPARGNDNPERAKNYERTQNKLKQMRDRADFRFTKIIQIPKVGRLEDALYYDPVYAKDCRFIVESFLHAPERVSLRISEILFQNTFIIVDGSFLCLEFDVGNHVDGLKSAPFVMIVEDSGSKLVKKLRNVFEHIHALSMLQKTLVVREPPGRANSTGPTT